MNASKLNNDERLQLLSRVERVIDRVRPALHADGGDAEVVDVTPEGRALIHLSGACGGCPMSPQTLHQGIERILQAEVPQITGVESV